MEKRINIVNIIFIKAAFVLFGLVLSPLLVVNYIDHKIKIRKRPFYKSIIVRYIEKFPRIYEFYILIMNFPLHYKVYQIIPKLSNNVLQVGCGTGAMNIYFSRHRANEKPELINLDVNQSFLNYGKKRKAYDACILSDIAKVPLKDQSFDTIVFARCLHHIKNHKPVFRECSRLLKANGTIIISEFLSVRKDEPERSYMMNSNIDGVIWRFTEQSFADHLNRNLPPDLRVRSITPIRQECITNYNFVFPNSDVVAVIGKVN